MIYKIYGCGDRGYERIASPSEFNKVINILDNFMFNGSQYEKFTVVKRENCSDFPMGTIHDVDEYMEFKKEYDPKVKVRR